MPFQHVLPVVHSPQPQRRPELPQQVQSRLLYPLGHLKGTLQLLQEAHHFCLARLQQFQLYALAGSAPRAAMPAKRAAAATEILRPGVHR